MDDEDFLAAVEADNANAEEVNTEAPAAEEASKPEAEAPAPAEPAPAEQPAPAAEPGPIMVPLTALHETRDKVKDLEARLAKLQPQPAPVEIPDRYEDPEGYEAYQEAVIQNRLLNITLNTSERFAKKEHGAETVEAAKAWATQRFASDPLYQQQVLADQDPYERVVTDYRRDQLFSKVSDPSEFDAFLAWKAANATLAATPPGAAPPNPTPTIPPRSLASAPSAGGITTEVVQSDAEIFEEVIPKG